MFAAHQLPVLSATDSNNREAGMTGALVLKGPLPWQALRWSSSVEGSSFLPEQSMQSRTWAVQSASRAIAAVPHCTVQCRGYRCALTGHFTHLTMAGTRISM